MKGNFKIKTLLEKYMNQTINQNELINETKKIFYKYLTDSRYNIEFIKEYYFMTEIVGLKDCTKTECDKYVRNYIDIYNGKKSHKSMISVQLCKEQLSEEQLEVLCLIEKLVLNSEISVQEINRINYFMGECNNNTIYDLVIDQLKHILQWGFDFYDDVLSYEPKSILYVTDESDLKNKVFEKIDSIIAALLGARPLWIECVYEKGNCSLQVLI